jgi:hypothetical protein
MFAMSVLAAHLTAWDKVRHIPFQTWLNLGICVLAVALVLRMWRTLKSLNDYAPWIALVMAGFMILCYWTYNRSEPRFLTPVVEKLALVMPTKAKQEQDLEKVRKGRDADP